MSVKSKLSVYILTHNSEKYLHKVLEAVSVVADDLVILDSGSTDATADIVARWNGRFLSRPLDNFSAQRQFAIDNCRYDYVFSLDSDEIPDQELLAHIQELKKTGFTEDAYAIQRHWFVAGQPVHCLYPVTSPDTTVRLLNRQKVDFRRPAHLHESPRGYERKQDLRGSVSHYTFETREELERKLEKYSSLAAVDLIRNKRSLSLFHQVAVPLALWVRWYLLHKGFLDGALGWRLGLFAFRHSWKKYAKARAIVRQGGLPPVKEVKAGGTVDEEVAA